VYQVHFLELWRDYFLRGTIVAIDPKLPGNFGPRERIQLFQGSQADTRFLSEVAMKAAPKGFDIISLTTAASQILWEMAAGGIGFFYRARHARRARRALSGRSASSASAFNLLFISGEICVATADPRGARDLIGPTRLRL
jgi:hypothetical protein